MYVYVYTCPKISRVHRVECIWYMYLHTYRALHTPHLPQPLYFYSTASASSASSLPLCPCALGVRRLRAASGSLSVWATGVPRYCMQVGEYIPIKQSTVQFTSRYSTLLYSTLLFLIIITLTLLYILTTIWRHSGYRGSSFSRRTVKVEYSTLPTPQQVPKYLLSSSHIYVYP